jgi:hypothetical protein
VISTGIFEVFFVIWAIWLLHMPIVVSAYDPTIYEPTLTLRLKINYSERSHAAHRRPLRCSCVCEQRAYIVSCDIIACGDCDAWCPPAAWVLVLGAAQL